jgi:hypothetical protein
MVWGYPGSACLQGLVRLLAAALVGNITALTGPIQISDFIGFPKWYQLSFGSPALECGTHG